MGQKTVKLSKVHGQIVRDLVHRNGRLIIAQRVINPAIGIRLVRVGQFRVCHPDARIINAGIGAKRGQAGQKPRAGRQQDQALHAWAVINQVNQPLHFALQG